MVTTSLPPATRMYRALVERDAGFEGVFVVGVTSTGIACRPTCPARKPRPEHCRWFARLEQAVDAGFRPCKRCRPEQLAGTPPGWLAGLLAAVEQQPDRRWTDADLTARGLSPVRVRRWFQREHGCSFHAWHRRRRLARAARQVRSGGDLLHTGMDAGYASDSGFREAFARLFDAPPGALRDRTARPTSVARLATPLGPMLAAAGDDGVCLLEFGDEDRLEPRVEGLRRLRGGPFTPDPHPLLAQLDEELGEYFEGRRRRFEVPLVLDGTDFQRAVWAQLLAVPWGETRSYDDIARALGKPGAQRAVGRANGDNRLAILVPCHRVVRSDGALSGYAAGVWRKRRLLEREGVTLDGGGDDGQGSLGF